MLYRNKIDITSIEGIEVDQGSLWRHNVSLDVIVLDDTDQYATHLLTNDFERQ